jgi:manganese/zinc/iron transport system permease protein
VIALAWWQDYTLRIVIGGAALLGLTSGLLGSWTVLRRQSLLGDAIAHAALPGVALAWLLTGRRETGILLLGAALAGGLGTLLVLRLVRGGRVKEDSALGIVLSGFFGLGLMLLTWIQRRPDAGQAGLETFLFGQAATLVAGDLWLMAALAALALAVCLLFWKEFKLVSFDPDFAASLGLPVSRIERILTALVVLGIVIGLQTVGVVLISAMLIAPVVAARQWTHHLGRLVMLAAGVGMAGGVGGVLLSAGANRLPTGPCIVLVTALLVGVSLAFAPRRGLVSAWLRTRHSRRRFDRHRVLAALKELEGQHPERPDHPHPAAVIRGMVPGVAVDGVLGRLAAHGLVQGPAARGWSLTDSGRRQALDHLPTGEER